MKLLVAGGRNKYLSNEGYLYLNRLHEQYNFDEIVNGAARGIDRCAREWALKHNIAVKSFPALWDRIDLSDSVVKTNKYGKKYDARAGIRRNRAMAQYCSESDVCLIFPGGDGSANMKTEATSRGMIVIDLMDDLSYVQ